MSHTTRSRHFQIFAWGLFLVVHQQNVININIIKLGPSIYYSERRCIEWGQHIEWHIEWVGKVLIGLEWVHWFRLESRYPYKCVQCTWA